MLDTDTSNSSTAQIDEGARMVPLGERVGLGVILRAIQEMVDKAVQHIVMDVGAREEARVSKLLPYLVEILAKAGCRIVVARPITLGSHNQSNAARFVDEAVKLGIAVVFIRNEGQGRLPEYFGRWQASRTRQDALAKGAVETYLEDADVRYADEALGYGISIADAAMGNFAKIADDGDRAEAEAFFNADVAAFLSYWLLQSVARFGRAVQEAIDNVEKRRRPDEEAALPDGSPSAGASIKRGKTR